MGDAGDGVRPRAGPGVLAERQARRDIARRHAKLAQAFLGKAVARLQGLDPRELTPGELLRYFQVAAEIERRAAGEDRQAWALRSVLRAGRRGAE